VTTPSDERENITTALADVDRGEFPRSSFACEFWEATRDLRLLVQYSRQSGQYQFFPLPISQRGHTRDLEWREVEPVGEIFAYTVTRRGPATFHGHEPYLVITVTLDIGVRMISNLVDCPIKDVAIGMRVRGTWLPLPDGTNLLLFRPDVPAGTELAAP